MIRGSMMLVLVVAACAGDPAPARRADSAGGETSGVGMGMRMPSLELLPGMRAHLDSLRAAGPAEIPALVAGHDSLAAGMLVAMDQDMEAMRMPRDADWRALADSVRADLEALPALGGEALVLRMRAHVGRLRRLLDRHEGMMKM